VTARITRPVTPEALAAAEADYRAARAAEAAASPYAPGSAARTMARGYAQATWERLLKWWDEEHARE
jgi:hypothetical protein